MNENTDRLSDEDFAQQIIQRARHIQPDKAFAAELEQKFMQSTIHQQKPKRASRGIVRLMGTMAAIFVLIVVATFNVPSLRAIAQEFIVLLSHAKADEGTGYYMEQPAEQLFASLEKAEADLSRDFVVPQYLPSIIRANKQISVEFTMLEYTAETSTVEISYNFALNSMWSLYFSQTPSEVYYGEDHGGTSIGASAEIETVTFNFRGKPVSAQFVKGGWRPTVDNESQSYESLQTATPSSVNLEWTTDGGQMYFMWEADGIVYSFYTSESRLFEINRDELIRIAESIK
jgi:hypothetical protein